MDLLDSLIYCVFLHFSFHPFNPHFLQTPSCPSISHLGQNDRLTKSILTRTLSAAPLMNCMYKWLPIRIFSPIRFTACDTWFMTVVAWNNSASLASFLFFLVSHSAFSSCNRTYESWACYKKNIFLLLSGSEPIPQSIALGAERAASHHPGNLHHFLCQLSQV